MASLVKNSKNYGLIWTDNSKNPTQVRESLKTDSRRKAQLKKKELEWKYHNGDHDPWERKWYQKDGYPKKLKPAVEKFIAYKLNARGRDGWNQTTARREPYLMRTFASFFGPIRVSQLTDKHLESFYYRKSVTSDHTRHSDYISINTFLNWCIKNEYINQKPHFRPPKPQTKVPKYITPQDLSEIIAWRTDRIKTYMHSNYTEKEAPYWIPLGWMVLAGTGMRPIELAHLKKSHLKERSVTIGVDFTTKSRAERQVPLLYESGQAASLLREISQTPYLLGVKPNYGKAKMSKDFTAAWTACFPDKPSRTLYNLKDMFAVRFLSDDSINSPAGMRLNDLKEILGHASLETTQRYLKSVNFGTNISGTIWDFPHVSQM